MTEQVAQLESGDHTIAPAAVTTSEAEQPNKHLDFAKLDALRRHMLLTVGSMVAILGTSRVSYYNWLKHGIKRKKTAEKIRKIVRSLVVCVSQHNWPDEAVFVANQAQRLKMLQELLEKLDNTPVE